MIQRMAHLLCPLAWEPIRLNMTTGTITHDGITGMRIGRIDGGLIGIIIIGGENGCTLRKATVIPTGRGFPHSKKVYFFLSCSRIRAAQTLPRQLARPTTITPAPPRLAKIVAEICKTS